MPRAESKNMGSQFYQDQSNSNSTFPAAQGQAGPPSHKKKHVCSTCDRAFTTSGHLARHSRVHTGEKNHKCPFPGCETRCSRQDNLQQHFTDPASATVSTYLQVQEEHHPSLRVHERLASLEQNEVHPVYWYHRPNQPNPSTTRLTATSRTSTSYIHSPPPEFPTTFGPCHVYPPPLCIANRQPTSRTSASPILESPYNHAYDSPNIPPPLSTSTMPSHSTQSTLSISVHLTPIAYNGEVSGFSTRNRWIHA
ncbi:hypothetical protein MPER_08759 [Moniliophthora perniciosa FA553]|nr:hypothetical protein MPER_08759 [Moniliophthora perniciosa FA553]